jgi:transposase-like protein
MTESPVRSPRVFSAAFKQAAMVRLEAGEALAALGRDLKVSRKVLYDWRKAWRAEGPAGIARKRGRKPGWRKPPPGPPEALADAQAQPETAALKRAEARIAELERTVGRQQMGLDFFRKALQDADADATDKPSAPGSTGSSKP